MDAAKIGSFWENGKFSSEYFAGRDVFWRL